MRSPIFVVWYLDIVFIKENREVVYMTVSHYQTPPGVVLNNFIQTTRIPNKLGLTSYPLINENISR